MIDTDCTKKERRCPRLGSAITFEYCLISGDNDDPCWKVLDCWWELFDVEAYLRGHLAADQFAALMARAAAPPRNKVLSIIELAQQAKNNRD